MGVRETEKAKLTATFFNGVAIAVIAVGVFAPVVAALAQSSSRSGLTLTLQVAVCLIGGVALHLLGRRFLDGLEP